jgi:thymidylate synthase (FAD)
METKIQMDHSDNNLIKVLDHGYVKLIDNMGSDLSFVNAARASFAKESDVMDSKDERLLKFLIKENHMSPFRHAFLSFEFKAPLMVARQHWKYVVGSDHTMDSWNESSRRYVTQEPEFYIPGSQDWRSMPENKKQGSGPNLCSEDGSKWTAALFSLVDHGEKLYNQAMEAGIAAEQARLFLPAYGMYVNYRWSCSFQSVILFLQQRLEEDSQYEIQLYAQAVQELIKDLYPVTINLFLGEDNVD